MATVDVEVRAGFVNLQKYCVFSLILLNYILVIGSENGVSASNTALKVKGVAISKLSFYNPDIDFTCLDGSRSIPFHHVNDDYCDCMDGTDEPGTSACANGQFYCVNAGYRPEYIFSSRVNDGICDCCDGSDESSGLANCSNTCNEMGKVMREEAERLRKLQQEGYQLYIDYQKQGLESKQQNQLKLQELQSQKQGLQDAKNEAEKIKNEAETPETEAKEKFDKEWEVLKAEKDAERETKKTEDSFKELDTNEDGEISVQEMQQHSEFDSNSDGEVSVDEVKEYFEDKESINFDVYKGKIWESIKHMYKKPQAEKPKEEELPKDEEDEDEDQEEGKDENAEEPDEDQKPDYDEETKKLIEVADQARDTFKQAEDKLNEHNRQMSDIQTTLALDMGANNEFYPLKGECYEFTDREYTYKICPFERASQAPKAGGHETNLGTWGTWSGPENNKYSQMKFEHGTGCWNGPERSATVNIHCGLTNELYSASEPSRCEYLFDFRTPALCNSQGTGKTSGHDEL
ncbi:glucosidase 2 subunit beta-like [Tubulanus polymorphus]|uniref:glucosidase 2 subunit beta-like n=1 Tax=Tubulanus polymorphus TaxID=672921 RepID=UPI003DA36981